jgi:predicted nuclease of predicted toxin-antitoxin system
MKPKFQADADLNEDIVTGVLRRMREIDFQAATEAGLEDLPDENVLEIAAHENRILITHDRKTMPKHFAAFVQSQTSAGVLIYFSKT